MKYLSIFLVANFALGAFAISEAEEQPATDIEKLGLDESFAGFVWQWPPAKDSGVMTAHVSPDKIMSGVKFEFNKKSGALMSIKPLLEEKDKAQEKQTIYLWGFDSFQEGHITIDTLWDIVRAVHGNKITDVDVLDLVTTGLSTYEEKWIPVQEGGPVQKSIKSLKLEHFIKDGKVHLMGAFLAQHEKLADEAKKQNKTR